MSMGAWNYEPLNEEEVMKERFQLLPDGVYHAHVNKSTPKMSKSGNPMAELILTVWNHDNTSKQIYDFLVLSRGMMWKIKHFCDSAKLSKEYEEGKFSPELAEKRDVLVRISIREGQEIPFDKLEGKPPGSKYPAKNVVEDYVVTEKGAVKVNLSAEPGLNDDLPF